MSEHRNRPREWAKPKVFLRRLIRVADHPADYTSERIVYAHYKRWALKHEMAFVKKKTFEKALDKIAAGKDRSADFTLELSEVIDHHGERLLPLIVMDDGERAAYRAVVDDLSRTRGRVRIETDLKFVDGILAAGAELDWMAPSIRERDELVRDAESQKRATGKRCTWLVVVWKDKRRRIPGDAVRRIV